MPGEYSSGDDCLAGCLCELVLTICCGVFCEAICNICCKRKTPDALVTCGTGGNLNLICFFQLIFILTGNELVLFKI